MNTEPIPRPCEGERAVIPLSPPQPSCFLLSPPSFPAKHKAQRKRHLLWEHSVLATNGRLAQCVEALALKYPRLTPMELRVCAMAKDTMPSWRIGQLLGISEKTVENHRLSARRKMKIRLRKPITPYLIAR